MHFIFETPRLILNRFTEQDAPLILQLNSDPEIVKYVHERALTTKEEATKILTEIILPQYKLNLGRWAIYTKEKNEFIGWCGLKYMQDKGITDLGYRLLKTAWGKGFATEAASCTIQYGLNILKIETITGMAHAENIASIKVLEKAGMIFQKEVIEDGIPVKVYTASLSV